MAEKSTFYLVREEILPEAIKKTIKVKEILKRGEIKTINEAVEKMGLSRSAYYKYKDYVYRVEKNSSDKIILNIKTQDEKGVLSSILKVITECNGNIITINQDHPVDGSAYITIAVDVSDLSVLVDELKVILNNIIGVKTVNLTLI